ncbi:hypothetical protein KIN20_019157, partial [Parelaphostrongylus tenuis]
DDSNAIEHTYFDSDVDSSDLVRSSPALMASTENACEVSCMSTSSEKAKTEEVKDQPRAKRRARRRHRLPLKKISNKTHVKDDVDVSAEAITLTNDLKREVINRLITSPALLTLAAVDDTWKELCATEVSRSLRSELVIDVEDFFRNRQRRLIQPVLHGRSGRLHLKKNRHKDYKEEEYLLISGADQSDFRKAKCSELILYINFAVMC